MYIIKNKNKHFCKGRPGGGDTREVWVDACVLLWPYFKTKITNFASLFKTKDLSLWPWFVSFRFAYKISAIKHRCNKCRPLIVNLYTLIKASGPKRHPRRLVVKLYNMLVPGWTCNDHQVRDETWTEPGTRLLSGGKGKKRSETANKSVSEASQGGRFGRVKGPLSASFFRLFPPLWSLVPRYTAPSQAGRLRSSNLFIGAWTIASTLSPETCNPRSNIMFPGNSIRVTGTNWYFWRFHSLYYFLPGFFTAWSISPWSSSTVLTTRKSSWISWAYGQSVGISVCVVVQFCPCFNFYFPLPHTHYHYIT